MNRKGRLFGSLRKTSECIFEERLTETWYNTYASFKYSLQRFKWYVALNKRGKPRRGDRAKKKQKFTHFLLRPVNYDTLTDLYGEEEVRRYYPPAVAAANARTSSTALSYVGR